MDSVSTSPMPLALKSEGVKSGHLYIVSTPIGNLGDITFRALDVLASVDRVAAEDTRNTARLLARFNIQKPMVSLHEHNEAYRSQALVEALRQGESLALVSDAGTPSLSDPGFVLVREVIAAGLPLVPVPGVSAAVTLMSVSGLPTDSFTFCGFPPKKAGRRRRWLQALSESRYPLIFYVSPHSLMGFLGELMDIFGDRHGVLGREMTKMYEEYLRGTLSEIAGALKSREKIRGECSLMVAGRGDSEGLDGGEDMEDLDALIAKALGEGVEKPSALAKRLAARLGMDRKDLYARILGMKTDS
ncbi:16S rRNA (cytidine1402-2'-O)-methyltransferase [Desulfobotulus alkaliphilus]|uniref:Ribosomal RNA small subunit methyltransferase I n=1 Tax=Desulfobotulus alkaliphilus TaxID=622671 RepID=A0A562RVX5_9BACT|nr:16S rRNA (cytidine(1402)-2'-O)-methyltransferase [Desulfobotulus alkaliphilus]TWI73269.1 16S rRNA (cytidine1402-2'-O)-methyltransferase [Desulfobotulus alkaliphilus]